MSLAERLAALSPQQRELFELRLRREGIDISKIPILPRAREQDSFPLSFAQQRLWFFDQLTPGNPFYNIPAAVSLTGQLDAEALERSLNEIVQRHESLRTTFRAVKGQPIQVIAPSLTVPLPVVELENFPDTEQAARLHELASQEAQEPFDLSRGPLLRVRLLRLGQERHVLLLNMHHIVSDGWSMGVFVRELGALYEAFSTGRPSPLAELAIQYLDFALWQRQWLQDQALETRLSYWKEQLQNAPAALELPTDRPRPVLKSFKGEAHSLSFSRPLVQALKTLSEQQGASLYMTLLTTFAVLLYRYTGQDDILIGSPIANRNRAETEDLIGFFVNTLVLRVDLSDDPPFRTLLERVREAALGAYAHQDLPFEKLVEETHPERNISRTPLFQVTFALQNVPMPPLKLPNLTLSLLDVHRGTSKFDLSLDVWETPEGLEGFLEYSADLFDAATIARMAEHFRTLLEGIAANPGQRLSTVPLLTWAERNRILAEWNDTRADYPLNQCVSELFEMQVEHSPKAVALVFEGQSLKYRELNQRTNQLAHYLRTLGVGPDVLVGICAERSLETIVGVLGILKAGGAYVPLDPEYPQERMAFILQDARVPVVLTQARLVSRLPAHQARVVCLDDDWETIARESQQNPSHNVTAQNPAYGIYTSGSTGQPKGVLVPHRGIVNQIFWLQAVLQLTAADRVIQKAAFAFDVSVREILFPLSIGARLVIARPGGHLDCAYLIRLIVEHEITYIHFVPPMLRVFVEEPGIEECNRSLRAVQSGGESVSFELQEQFFSRLNACLLHAYGPTEVAVTAVFWLCERGGDRRIVPIGHPVANTQAYVLDKHMIPIPVRVIGELYLGGDGLARGYLDPELTAEKFVPDPFTQEPGGRLYKTGDLCRYWPDGSIQFLGRIDSQVKVRGYRVELGEIEAALRQYAAVRQAVVLVRKPAPGKEHLAAYLVTDPNNKPTSNELRSFLANKLPDYMVPTAFVLLDAMPLMPSGKIDHQALLATDNPPDEAEEAFAPPGTEIERQLAAIWQEVLDLETVSVRDNFFDMGGHSLLMVKVQNRIQELVKQDVPIVELFRHPTIKSLADYLSQQQAQEPSFQQALDRTLQQREAIKQHMQHMQAARGGARDA